ncbi:MAG: cobalamin-binding protein [Allorhizobium sp.]
MIDNRARPAHPARVRMHTYKSNGSLAPRGWAGYLVSSEREKLRSIIQATVAPMTAHRLASRYDVGLEHDSRYGTALANFCSLVVRPGVRLAVMLDFLRDELPAGRTNFVKILFIEATARLLGQKWSSDDCDFVDVTIGTARLQEIIKVLSYEFRSLQANADAPFVALLSPVGEQHTLMQHLLGLLFDAMGWPSHILEGQDMKGPRLQSTIEQADIVCIGWSNQRLKAEFSTLVGTVRSHGSTPRLPIITGGAAALRSIDFIVNLGIDCICDSVYSASRICERFYELETLSQKAQGPGRMAAVNASGIDWRTL